MQPGSKHPVPRTGCLWSPCYYTSCEFSRYTIYKYSRGISCGYHDELENNTLRLLLVRHGLTHSNVQARYSGQTDVPLTEVGERQAEAVGKRLAAEPLDVIVSSDLQRASKTADAIARHHGLPVWHDADLRETHLGEWE